MMTSRGVRWAPRPVALAAGTARHRRLLHPPGAGKPGQRLGERAVALARAPQLDEAERTHLFDLARAAYTAVTTATAYVRNGRLDILGANQLGRAVFAPLFADSVRPANIARFIFLDPASQEFSVEWDRLATDTVGLLRTEAGHDPYDRALSDLIGELSTRSETFRTLWAAHNVRLHRSGVKHPHHPVAGDLILTYESMELTAAQGLRLNAYTAGQPRGRFGTPGPGER